MRYFHRTSLSRNAVLEEADRHFANRLQVAQTGQRTREYAGAAGKISLRVEAEGGHYTLVNVATNQLSESEADRLAKGFITSVHKRVHSAHVARGAY